MKLNSQTKNILFQVSAMLILLAAIAYYFDTDIAKYTMMGGVIGFAAVTFTTPYPGKSLRGKRLFNIKVFAVLLMIIATFLMFMDMSGWVVALLISALLTLYSSIVLSMTYEKEKKEEQE